MSSEKKFKLLRLSLEECANTHLFLETTGNYLDHPISCFNSYRTTVICNEKASKNPSVQSETQKSGLKDFVQSVRLTPR